jgi:hypothetical protein
VFRCLQGRRTNTRTQDNILRSNEPSITPSQGDVPPEFDIRDLQQPPVAYQKSRRAEPGTRSFGEALKITMKLRPAVT